MPEHVQPSIAWAVSDTPISYVEAVAFMEDRVRAIHSADAPEMVWLLEHPSLLTAGTRARPEDLLDPSRLPVFPSGRGGEYTYHGPGQRVVYVMLDVRRRFGGDVRAFVAALEDWIIAALGTLGVCGKRIPGLTGVWVAGASDTVSTQDAKIAALGLRVRRGVSFHGFALNVAPDLSFYDSIVPCGIRDRGVTSLAALGVVPTMPDVDHVLRQAFERLVAPVCVTAAPHFTDAEGPDSVHGPADRLSARAFDVAPR